MPDHKKDSEQDVRRRIVEAARRLSEYGLNLNAEGNISVRRGEGCLITPSGVAAETLSPEDIVAVDLTGKVIKGGQPSSEWPLHTAILSERPEINAAVHSHAVFCSVLACQRRDIPAFHYMVAEFGGADVRCAAYATFGSHELSANALAALRQRQACLLANHGAVALGNSLEQAVNRASALEKLARQYWLSLQNGGPVLLDMTEMERVSARFRGYGGG